MTMPTPNPERPKPRYTAGGGGDGTPWTRPLPEPANLFVGPSAAERSRLDRNGAPRLHDVNRAGGFESAGRAGWVGMDMPVGGWPKRAMDIAIASAALLLASPVMIAVAVMIKMLTGGPALFAHRRIGFNGKPFKCYKFCTMVRNAEAALEAHLAGDPEAAREWAESRKLKRDPRVTALGRLLRLSSLDELPQLFNILCGEMSCVGPRPVVSDELERYGALLPDYLAARPGLTGLWQVTGRDDVDYERRVRLDSQYVRNWSLRSDVVILLRTVFAVLRFEQAS